MAGLGEYSAATSRGQYIVGSTLSQYLQGLFHLDKVQLLAVIFPPWRGRCQTVLPGLPIGRTQYAARYSWAIVSMYPM